MCIFPQCFDCKNFIKKYDNDKYVCKAFPDGIPDDVLMNRVDHSAPIENDNGIHFEQVDYTTNRP